MIVNRRPPVKLPPEWLMDLMAGWASYMYVWPDGDSWRRTRHRLKTRSVIFPGIEISLPQDTQQIQQGRKPLPGTAAIGQALAWGK